MILRRSSTFGTLPFLLLNTLENKSGNNRPNTVPTITAMGNLSQTRLLQNNQIEKLKQ